MNEYKKIQKGIRKQLRSKERLDMIRCVVSDIFCIATLIIIFGVGTLARKIKS
jgi:hypothetical protein